MSLGDVEEFVKAIDERPFRAKQIFAWLHQKNASNFDQMTDLSKALREKLQARARILRPVVDVVQVSSDGTRKYRLTTHDGHAIEAVWIPSASGPGRNALCISSQVGCAMGCTFCATASLKLLRNLTAGEIVGQLYAVLEELETSGALVKAAGAARDAYDDEDVEDEGPGLPPSSSPGSSHGSSPSPVRNIVFMGMGEPLHNVDGVIAAVKLLTHPAGQAMSPRRITVSTSGLVPAIARLGAETDVHLAVSLNASNDEVRAQVMPVDKKYPIEVLLEACRAFPLKPRRRITFEYVLLAGVNDSDDDARRVVDLLQGMRTKVNLIPYNPHPLSPFARPDAERVESFRKILDRGHVSCFIRTTRGLDIDAACGMLGAKKLEEARRVGGGGGLPVLA